MMEKRRILFQKQIKRGGNMILVLGGARSGKSTYAEQKAAICAQEQHSEVLYIATAIAFDKDMKNRIKKHQDQRDANWHTIEQYKDFQNLSDAEAFQRSQIVLVDCITLMVSNLLLEYDGDFDTITCDAIDILEQRIVSEVNRLVAICKTNHKQLVVVSNEVGLGLVPAYRLGCIFRDIAGRINQLLARESDEVYLLTAGIPLTLK